MSKAGFGLLDMRYFSTSGRKSTTRKPLYQKRDALVQEGDKTIYYVWGHPIASLHTTKSGARKLMVSDEGYRTKLTKDRLNKVLPVGMKIRQKNYKWLISKDGKEFPFRGRMELKV